MELAGTETLKERAKREAKAEVDKENFEIYIHEKDEQEILDLLLAKQNPKQKEIRQNEKREQYRKSDAGLFLPSIEDRINGDIKHQIVLYGGAA